MRIFRKYIDAALRGATLAGGTLLYLVAIAGVMVFAVGLAIRNRLSISGRPVEPPGAAGSRASTAPPPIRD